MSVGMAVEPEAVAAESFADRRLFRRILRNPIAAVSIAFLAAIALIGILAPWIAPFPAEYTQLQLTNVPPFQSEYILGGDQAGRDILSRLLLSTLGALQSGVILLVVSLAIGATTGLVAGYYGGRTDGVLTWFASIVITLPGFTLLVSVYTLFGSQITLYMAVFGVLVAPAYFYLVKTLVYGVRNELYIDAARVAGLNDRRIIARHVLRAVRGPIIVQSAFILAAGIGIQAGLEFLGLGGNGVSWGGMLNAAFNNIYLAPWNIVWPAALITLMTLALVLIGGVVRDTVQSSGTRHPALTPKAVRRLQAQQVGQRGASSAAGGSGAPLLAVRDLAIGYPKSLTDVEPVVTGVDLVVERGEIRGLVGESGSGKSQIAFAILGILPREAVVLRGAVEFHGRNLLQNNGWEKVRGRQIAYIPQEPMSNLDPTFTVGQQLSFGLRAVKKISKREAKHTIIGLLDRVGIKNPDAVFDLYPHQVSGGMAQRVLIAGALAGDPELIIADEPTTALDVTVQASVLELLRDLQRERDLGMILVTHNFGVVADICDTVSVMKQGRIIESKPVDALFAAPEHEYTQMLLSSSLAHVEPRPEFIPREEGA